MKRILNNKKVQAILWIAAIIAAWEFVSRAGFVNTYILPPFTAVAKEVVSEFFGGKLGIQTLNSLWVIFQGFGISIALSVVITLLCVWFPPFESLFNTLSTIMNPLPSVAIMPLIIMWFGIDMTAMLVIIIHGVLWALVRHLLDGIRAVPKVQLEWGRNIGLTSLQIFRGVLLYAITPELLAGLRIGWGRAWRALISAEMVFGMIGSLGGLGYYIYIGRAYAKITQVLAGIIVIVLIGLLIESLLFKQIEKHTIVKWGISHE